MTTSTSFRVAILDHPQGGPYTLEQEAVAAAGGELTVVALDALDRQPIACDVAINAGDWPLPQARLDRLTGCRAVVGYGVGVDWIDRAQARERGLLVVNTPHANVEDVAVHSLALVLACVRDLVAQHEQVRGGGWRLPDREPPRRIAGQRLGLLAFGNIPRRLAALAVPLGFDVLAHDPYVEPEEMAALGVRSVELEQLLATADVLSVHLPAVAGAPPFLDAARLGLMRPGAALVVTSRGAVYDPAAVADALQSGRLGCAALDVFPTEPPTAGDPLRRAPNLLLTPHVAGWSAASERDAHRNVAAALAVLARGEIPATAVNAADLAPPAS
jgi:D-3-phosphoglycerate dehydrogenase / 2-oxoglutarate reductase